MDPIGLTHYLVLGSFLFVCGLTCMIVKRNAIGILIGLELALNGGNLNFVAISRYTAFGLDGQIMALFVIVLAASEAAVALAIVLAYYNTFLTVDVDRADELRG